MLLFAAGCDDDDEGTIVDDQVDVAIDAGRARGDDLANQTDDDLQGQSEAIAVGTSAHIMFTIDMGEILQAQTILNLGAEPLVAEYAQMMIDEHSRHQELVLGLTSDLGLALLENRTSDALQAESLAVIDEMRNSNDPNLVYMTAQVMMHEEASIIVDSLGDHVQTEAFEVLIDDTVDLIELHRQEASDILRALLGQ